MSYLVASTTKDELLLMIAAETTRGTGDRPKPYEPTEHWNAETDPYFNFRPPACPPFIYLNITNNLMDLYRAYLIYENPRIYHGIHLTWKGWDRVEELLEAGAQLPTKESLSEYARYAMRVVEGGDRGDFIPPDVPNPRGIEHYADEPAPKQRWWRRFFK